MQILRSLVKGQQKRTKNRLLKLGNRRESPKIVIPETLVSYNIHMIVIDYMFIKILCISCNKSLSDDIHL